MRKNKDQIQEPDNNEPKSDYREILEMLGDQQEPSQALRDATVVDLNKQRPFGPPLTELEAEEIITQILPEPETINKPKKKNSKNS